MSRNVAALRSLNRNPPPAEVIVIARFLKRAQRTYSSDSAWTAGLLLAFGLVATTASLWIRLAT